MKKTIIIILILIPTILLGSLIWGIYRTWDSSIYSETVIVQRVHHDMGSFLHPGVVEVWVYCNSSVEQPVKFWVGSGTNAIPDAVIIKEGDTIVLYWELETWKDNLGNSDTRHKVIDFDFVGESV